MKWPVVAIAVMAAAPCFAQSPGSEYVGQRRWIAAFSSMGIRVCDRVGNPLDAKCDNRSKVGFVVGAVVANPTGSPSFRIDFGDGSSGYIGEADLKFQTTTVDPAAAAAACKKRGQPAIGMTTAQVTASCWGRPSHVNRTETGSVHLDQFVYSGDRYVYLRNGVVESIQTSGRLR